MLSRIQLKGRFQQQVLIYWIGKTKLFCSRKPVSHKAQLYFHINKLDISCTVLVDFGIEFVWVSVRGFEKPTPTWRLNKTNHLKLFYSVLKFVWLSHFQLTATNRRSVSFFVCRILCKIGLHNFCFKCLSASIRNKHCFVKTESCLH